MEQFKIINYKGIEINVGNFGTIIINNKLIKPRLSPDGYLVFGYKINNKYTTIRVHRLVAIAFIPNPNNLEEVNHKDFNRANPKWDNLEWMTHKDNVEYSKNAGHYKGKCGSNNPNYGNNKLKEIYKNNPDLAKEKQSRKGIMNGRCKKVKLYIDGKFIKEFEYINSLCEYLINKYNFKTTIDSLRTTLRKCNKENKLYRGRFFMKYV